MSVSSAESLGGRIGARLELKCVKLPNDALAYENKVFLNPTEAAALKSPNSPGDYILVGGFIYTIG